jgi:hypothetical protein
MHKKIYLIVLVSVILLFSTTIIAGKNGDTEGTINESGTVEHPTKNIALSATATLKNSTDISEGIDLTVECAKGNCSGQIFTVDLWALKESETGAAFKSFHDNQKDTGTFTYNSIKLSNRYRQFILKEKTSNVFTFTGTQKTISITPASLYYAAGKANSRSRKVPSECNADESLNKCIKKIWSGQSTENPSFNEYVSFIRNTVNSSLNEKYKFYLVLELGVDTDGDGKIEWIVSQLPIPLNEEEPEAEDIVLIEEIPFIDESELNCSQCSSIEHCLACLNKKIITSLWNN